jgi:hypothetical protein
MKVVTFKFSAVLSVVFLMVLFIAPACSKLGSGNSGGYPKNVTILYKLTPSGGYTTGDIGYLNETGSVTYLTNQSLSFTKQITRTVNKNDGASLNVSSIGNGSIKMEIFVDGNLVKTETPSGNVVNTTIVHLFQ